MIPNVDTDFYTVRADSGMRKSATVSRRNPGFSSLDFGRGFGIARLAGRSPRRWSWSRRRLASGPLSEIADELTELGRVTSTGKTFTGTQVKRLLNAKLAALEQASGHRHLAGRRPGSAAGFRGYCGRAAAGRGPHRRLIAHLYDRRGTRKFSLTALAAEYGRNCRIVTLRQTRTGGG
jgi:hypothetical protein